ncbi:MAG TPA: hypothetical protein VL916_02435, partial [Ilumatobacteraceae bacterium]|nr:hypothetical protein [Ilumatobacteraceae bacterium]
YHGMMLLLERGMRLDRDAALRKLVEIQYERTSADLRRGAFRVRGDTVEIWPSYADDAVRIEFFGDEIESLSRVDPVRGVRVEPLERHPVYPNSHYVTPRETLLHAIDSIHEELGQRTGELERAGRLLEAQRLHQRTSFDLEMLREVGYCHGIENYSRHLTGRAPGDPPPTLMDYLHADTLLVIDESHATDDELRPRQLSEPPIDDLQRGPACAVVEQRIGVERRDIDRLIEQLFERRRRCATGIDPAVERGDQDRREQVAGIARTARSGQ